MPSTPFRFSRQSARARHGGFTLVEVITGCVLFSALACGAYMTLIYSYKLAALSRTRDEARAVIRTFADQFERLQTTTSVVSGSSYTRWLFYPEGGPSGRGLVWGGLSDSNVFDTPLAAVAGLNVSLGQATHPIPAVVTRDVTFVNAADGTDASTQSIQAAGYMMKGVFSISYTVNATKYTQSITVLRAVP